METQISSAPIAHGIQAGQKMASGGLIDKTLQHLKDYAQRVEQAPARESYQQSALAAKGIGAKVNKAI